jgi:hypothetical protein
VAVKPARSATAASVAASGLTPTPDLLRFTRGM